MLHQTLTPPFRQFPFHHHTISAAAAAGFLHPPPPPTTGTPPRASTQTVQGERESRGMEVVEASAIKKPNRQEAAPPPEPQQQQQQQQQGFLLPDDVAWAAERGGLLGEEFSVDDLLDFEGLDTDKEEAEEEVEETTKGDAFLEQKEPAGDSLPAPPLSDINFPAHDAAEFEWMNSIMDDSVPEYPLSHGVAPYRPSSETTARSQFRADRREPKQEPGWAEYMPAPESPAATIVCKLSTEDLVPVKAKRSKRPRTAGKSWPNLSAGAFTDSSATTTTTTTTSPSSSCSSASSPSSNYFFLYDSHHPAFLPSPAKKPKKRGRKPKHAAAAAEMVVASGDRRCTHCGAQKTPQWRAGPAGPKTLCNACGVRYKSGRLVPEYRPAASPTFVSHVHSNSHRKVLEMRRKKEEEVVVAAAPAVATF